MRPAVAVLLLWLLPMPLLVGCSEAETVDGTVRGSAGTAPVEGPRGGTASVAGDVPEATVGTASTGERAEEVVGSSGEPFVADPEAVGGSGYRADTVLTVRYGSHEGYERVVVDLGTGVEPTATVPRWTLSSSMEDGLLRVTLPSVSATSVSEGRLGERLLGSFHVVRAPEGGMFIDFFARRAFLYRVFEVGDPARLIVDLKPAGTPLKVPPPAEGGETVLVEPRSGDRISDPLTVIGYSRNLEAANTITLIDSGGEVMIRRTVLGNDWSSTWGYFEATLDLPSFSGKGTLRVGTASVRDGSFKGVEIPVRGD